MFLCEEISSQKKVAVKLMKESYLAECSINSTASFLNEVSILKGLEHQGIVQLLDYGQTGTIVYSNDNVQEGLTYIVMEYVDGGSLGDLARKKPAPFPEDEVREFARIRVRHLTMFFLILQINKVN